MFLLSRRGTLQPTLALAALALLVGGCGGGGSESPASSSNSGSSSQSSGRGKRPVSVIFAGSLTGLMEDRIGPGFQSASGYGYEGFGGGSGEDAIQIKSKVRQADVFVSASATADTALEGAANGGWVSWYSTFATTPLVLGYNPKSKLGEQLAHGRPWYQLITAPGIRVGRTDPKLDPKGALTVEALDSVSKRLKDRTLLDALSSFPVYPETDLVGRLQSGQLDAGFFYAIEANVAHIPSVTLDPASETAAYTVTILNHAPQQAGAEAFVRYLLDASRASTLKSSGLAPLAPKLAGVQRAVPGGVRSAVGATGPAG